MPVAGSFNFFICVRKRLPFMAKQNSRGVVSRQLFKPLGWQTIEGVVEFDRVEMLRIRVQHLRSRQFLRIEGAAPVLIVPAGGSDECLRPPPHAAAISCKIRSASAAGSTARVICRPITR